MNHSSLTSRLTWIIVTVGITGFSVAACNSSHVTQSLGTEQNVEMSRGSQEVVYGDDNRVDYFEEQDPSLRVLSESTVALMSRKQLGAAVNGLRALTGENYARSLGLCPDEKFASQNASAFCSGFLIGADLIATAGHCIPDLQTCGETAFAFGYRISQQGSLPTSIPDQDVYECASVIHTQSISSGADFAIVKLSRPVKNRAPLSLRMNGTIAVGENVTLMGYPEGLPLKIAGGAQVRSSSAPGFFVANTDSYGGNSGSAVINTLTHEVEGILVRGEKDFEWTPQGCARTYRCKEDACRGEDVTRITEIAKALNALR